MNKKIRGLASPISCSAPVPLEVPEKSKMSWVIVIANNEKKQLNFDTSKVIWNTVIYAVEFGGVG